MSQNLVSKVMKEVELELESQFSQGQHQGDFDDGLLHGAAIVMHAFTRSLKAEAEERAALMGEVRQEYDRLLGKLSEKYFLSTED